MKNSFLDLIKICAIFLDAPLRSVSEQWKISELRTSYSNTNKQCKLCTAKAFHTPFSSKATALNKTSEISKSVDINGSSPFPVL